MASASLLSRDQVALTLAERGNPALLGRHLLGPGRFFLYRHTRLIASRLAACVMRPNGRLIIVMPPRYGKLLHVDTPVATPDGWKRLGDVQAGDEVFDPSGCPVRVTVAHDVEQTEMWRVRFSDGTELLTGPEHQWSTSTWTESRRLTDQRRRTTGEANDFWPDRWWEERYFQIRRTDQIAESIRERHRIPTTAPLRLADREIPVDPWLLGFWLGDGSRGCSQMTVGEADVNDVAALIGDASRRRDPRTGAWTLGVPGLAAALRLVGPRVLSDKEIPDAVLWGSESQRLSLLRGLMDADGGIERAGGRAKGRVSFTSTSKHLAEVVRFLAASLGETTTQDERPSRLNGEATGTTAYRVSWSCYRHVPFLLPRKASQVGMEGRRHRQRGTRYLSEVAPTGVVGDLRCLTVEGGMWLAGDQMVPTHNTLMSSILLPLWFLECFPDQRVILASYAAELSRLNSREARNLVSSYPDKMRLRLAQDSKAAYRWNTPEGGGLLSTGVDGTMTGFGGDAVILDDLYKDWRSAHSPTVRENTWNWYRSVPRQRLEPDASLVVTMCLAGDTLVLMGDGTERSLREIRPGDQVASFDDDNNVVTTRVLNWANQGQDDVYALRLASGREVRGNARHPFWVMNDDGSGSWVRLGSLRVGMKVRCLTATASGMGSSAPPTGATSPPGARACVTSTTGEPAGQPDTGRRQRAMLGAGRSGSKVGTASHPRTTTASSPSRVVGAPSVEDSSVRSHAPVIGQRSSALTTTTTPAPCGACCATTATSSSPGGEPLTSFSGPLDTWPSTTDEIVAIEAAGREDVFDIEVEGTHRFIANGLDSSNTRWHEEDLVGMLLAGADDDDPYPWEILRLTAIAEPADGESDPLGRSEGEVLCPERFDETAVHSAMSDAGPYLSAGMFQQRPAAREGTMFKKDRWGDVGAVPADLRLLVRWWDLAATEGAGDYTAGVLLAVAEDGFTYIVDVISGQWAADEVERNFLATTVADRDHYGNRVHTVIEQEPGASGKIVGQGWVRKAGGRAETKPNSGDKELRSLPLSAQQLAGNVRLVRDRNGERPSWWDDLIGEATLFPNGRNDDIVDAAASAYNHITAKPRRSKARARTAAGQSI